MQRPASPFLDIRRRVKTVAFGGKGRAGEKTRVKPHELPSRGAHAAPEGLRQHARFVSTAPADADAPALRRRLSDGEADVRR